MDECLAASSVPAADWEQRWAVAEQAKKVAEAVFRIEMGLPACVCVGLPWS